jgi:CDP-glycerol glycerophosphotransferase (TagB/SpsB family)
MKKDRQSLTILESFINGIFIEDEKVHFQGRFSINNKVDIEENDIYLVFKGEEKKFGIKVGDFELVENDPLLCIFTAEIPVKNIHKSIKFGKWDIWIEIENRNKVIAKQLMKERLGLETEVLRLNQLVLWKFSRIQDNQLSITSVNLKKESKKYQIENSLLGIKVIKPGTALLKIFGSFYGGTEEGKHVRIINRDTDQSFSFPFFVNENGEGKVEIDFQALNDGELTHGIWDFYIVENYKGLELVTRLRNTDENFQNDHPSLLLNNEKQMATVKFYQTIKENFSLIVDNISIQGELTKMNMDSWNLQLSCQLQNDFFSQMDISFSPICRLIKRNSNEQVDFHANIMINDETQELDFQAEIDLTKMINTNNDELKGRWDFYLVGKIHDQVESILLCFPTEQINRYEFMKDFKQDEDDDILQCYLYLNKNKGLSFTINSLRIIRDIEVFKAKNGYLYMKGWAFVDGKNMSREMKKSIVLHKRFTEEKIVVPIKAKERQDVSLKFGKELMDYNWSGFEIKINMRKINHSSFLTNGIWDFYIVIEHDGKYVSRKLGFRKYVYRKDRNTGSISAFDYKSKQLKEHYFSLTPRGNIKIEVLTFDFLSKFLMFISPLLYILFFKKKDIWIIGERPDTAQDTGYHFFKYCREKYPSKEIYYAIDPDSNDLGNISDLGNVLLFGTRKHFLYSLVASTYISSHDNEYFLPFKGPSLFNYRKARKVFIQHGVLGRKNVEYHRKFYDYPFDMFCVSSTGEKELVVNRMGYTKKVVKITGLSRFDALPLEQNLSASRKILCIPTWREWLTSDEVFLESNYYKRYCEFLQSKELQDILEKYNLEFIFYPHYRMQPYIEFFNIPNNDRMTIIKLGEKNVQDLLIESSIMITDFSSVSFDFSYMSKPVIFYHFDFDDFFQRGILRAPEETFLGSIVNNISSINHELEYYIQNDFREKEEVRQSKDLIFTHVDHKNCERIYQEIVGIRKRRYYPEFLKSIYRKAIGKLK